uniref:Peptidase S1 domain-containing protein n=1 Tax=Daphnia galeata TaxID=27404 RepID=A0A8J2S3G4_9CRUS|nr:unnamed protein product [Daphnia galeata]
MHFILLIVIALVCLDGFVHCESYSPLIHDSNLVTKKNYFPIQLYAVVLYVHFIVGTGVPNVKIIGGSAASAGEFPSMDNDIAMLVLSSPVANVTPVTFPVDSPVISSTVRPTSSKPTTTKPTTTTSKTTTRKPPTTMKTTTGKITTITGKPCSCSTLFPPRTSSPVLMRAFSTYANSVAVIAGWGTGSGSGTSGGFSNVLLKANVIIRDNSFCSAQYGPSFIGADMMCASGPSGTGFCYTLGLAFLVGGAYSKSLEAVEAELGNSPSNRIIGGVPALPGEFPSMANRRVIFWITSMWWNIDRTFPRLNGG